MAKIQTQVAPTIHCYEETFGASTTLTYESRFKKTHGIQVTSAKATATALIFAWSRSGTTITITASASSSETITIWENGRV